MDYVLPLLAIIVACYWIYCSCDRFELGANYLGRSLGPGVRGATINAIGSSAPELITTLIFLFAVDGTGMAEGVATTAGSGAYNILIIPAVCILMVSFSVGAYDFNLNKKVVIRDGVALLTVEAMLIYFMYNGVIEAWHGLMFLLAYAIYITFTLTVNLGEPVEDGDDFGDMTTKKALGWLALSITELTVACFIMATAVVSISGSAGILPFFSAVILAAAATSVPDMLISMNDAKTGNADDAVSNAVGSNIFDIAAIYGICSLIYCSIHGPVTLPNPEPVADLRIALFTVSAATIATLLFVKTLGKTVAYFLLSMYVLFAGYTIYSAFTF